MNPNELDRILLSEKPLEPSAAFLRGVMARIEIENSCRRRAPFPWFQFTILMLAAALAAVWAFPADAALRTTYRFSYAIGEWMMAIPDLTGGSTPALALASILGTFLLVWLALRLVESGN
jgi:hypothetical protein